MNEELSQKIVERLHELVHRKVTVLRLDDPRIKNAKYRIELQYNGKSMGAVIIPKELDSATTRDFIKAIGELLIHEHLLLSQVPASERLDKFIYDLLHKPEVDEEQMATEATIFSVDLELPRVLFIVQLEDGHDEDLLSDKELKIARYKKNLARALDSYFTKTPENIVAYLGNNQFVLLKDVGSSEDLESNIDNFKKSLDSTLKLIKTELKEDLTVGVGDYHPGINGLRRSYDQAKSALELGSSSWGLNRIYHIDQFGTVAPLFSGIDNTNITYSKQLLKRLSKAPEIIGTLEVFFDCNMSLTESAKELNIHRNTLVYRLDKIADVLGLDPRQFDQAVQIKLAIIFAQFAEEKI